tara:strand:- start:15438 stop:16454 length:1017 start_codon:yes stop_codon:yes gene_type:complete
MKYLVTGSAGFIGFSVSKKLLDDGYDVVGIDNHNDYYDPKIKDSRLEMLTKHESYKHFKADLSIKDKIDEIFKDTKPDCVINLAAQAGVRYSLENPHAYIQSNIVGFMNILEACKHFCVKHLVYASSSSVYGANTKLPFSIHDNVDHPVSLYAASKKANELMAHTYSHLFNLPTTGLRFFTVYGPWGRPDMALFKFTKSIINGETIKVFNNGNHERDFTYIDDIVEGVIRVANKPAKPDDNWSGDKPDPGSSSAPWRVYNIGNNNPENLMEFIEVIENEIGQKASKEFLPMQPGDVPDTFADIDDLKKDFNFQPSTSLKDGVRKFIDWYFDYYKVNRK